MPLAARTPPPAPLDTLLAGAEEDGLVLNSVAGALRISHRGRHTEAGSIDKRLTPPVRIALNTWAGPAIDLDLAVAVPEQAEALVLGTADVKTMERAADVLDKTWELLEPLMAERPRRRGGAILVLLFGRAGFRSEAWAGTIDALVRAGLIAASTGSQLRYSPGGLTVFSGRLFIQPSFDQAGDAAAGDDEFRLDNELAHKLTVSLLRSRFGQVPECMRWGLGYVAEQRLFRSIYQFDRLGFVGVEEHFDWPKRARAALKKLVKGRMELQFGELLTAEQAAGRPGPPQFVTWGTLDYLLDRDPQRLAGLLTELAELHDAAAATHAISAYAGTRDASVAVIDDRLAMLNAKQLNKHLKRVK